MSIRTFRVTVDGETFEVEVEEVAGLARPPEVSAPPAAARPATPVRPEGAGTAVASAAKPSPVGEGRDRVDAPLPGTIVDIVAHPGQEIKAGEVLLVLEAMKMQNEIVSPRAGTVRDILVSKGDTVGVGDPLVLLD